MLLYYLVPEWCLEVEAQVLCCADAGPDVLLLYCSLLATLVATAALLLLHTAPAYIWSGVTVP